MQKPRRRNPAGLFCCGVLMETNVKLMKEMINKRMCVSRAEARRLILAMPENEIRKRMDKIKVLKYQKMR